MCVRATFSSWSCLLWKHKKNSSNFTPSPSSHQTMATFCSTVFCMCSMCLPHSSMSFLMPTLTSLTAHTLIESASRTKKELLRDFFNLLSMPLSLLSSFSAKTRALVRVSRSSLLKYVYANTMFCSIFNVKIYVLCAFFAFFGLFW